MFALGYPCNSPGLQWRTSQYLRCPGLMALLDTHQAFNTGAFGVSRALSPLPLHVG